MVGTDATSFPAYEPTAPNLIRWCADTWGDETFAVLGGKRLSYRDAEVRSAALAKGLLASGIGKGAHVALLAPNSPEWIIGWLAITRIGGVAVLLNTYSKARELGWLLRHSDSHALLTVDAYLGHDYLARLEDAVAGLAASEAPLLLEGAPFLRSIWTWGEGERAWARPVDGIDGLVEAGAGIGDPLLAAAEAEVSPADPMVVVYSSGSTADPKGAVHAHGAVVRHAHNLWPMRDLHEGDVLYTPMPLFWVGGFSFTLVGAMHAGAAVVFDAGFEPGTTLELIERERVTHVLGWPHLAKALADHPTFADRDLSAVRYGKVLMHLPNAEELGALEPVPNSLGMTETLGPHTYAPHEPLPPGKEGSFGFSVPGVEHRIVDPVTGDDLPVGETGEVWVRGYSLMLGLHRRERADTFTADGWYRTGDGGYFDADGHFYYTGRLGDQIKTSGMNVTPRDVELALEALPEVVLAYVCGVDHPHRGQDVVAAIALSPGTELSEDEARVRVKEELSSYMVPRHIAVFADQTQLPWLDSGKVDRRRLTAILEAQFRED